MMNEKKLCFTKSDQQPVFFLLSVYFYSSAILVQWTKKLCQIDKRAPLLHL